MTDCNFSIKIPESGLHKAYEGVCIVRQAHSFMAGIENIYNIYFDDITNHIVADFNICTTSSKGIWINISDIMGLILNEYNKDDDFHSDIAENKFLLIDKLIAKNISCIRLLPNLADLDKKARFELHCYMPINDVFKYLKSTNTIVYKLLDTIRMNVFDGFTKITNTSKDDCDSCKYKQFYDNCKDFYNDCKDLINKSIKQNESV